MPLEAQELTQRTRALDVGAGIGRVTSTVLLHLIQDVVLLEPVDHFVQEALARVSAPSHMKGDWKGIDDNARSVIVVQGTLQEFDPRRPVSGSENGIVLSRAGYTPPGGALEYGFDVVWCQWCLGHLTDDDLVDFLRRSKESLRSKQKGTGDFEGIIVVKENLCSETTPGQPRAVFDEEDSSVTRYEYVVACQRSLILSSSSLRSDNAFKKAFRAAGLQILKEDIQLGLPEGLYPVKMSVSPSLLPLPADYPKVRPALSPRIWLEEYTTVSCM